jgi:ribosomal protein L40E
VIVCKHCGHANAHDAQFCGSCSAFLEWDGERVAETEGGVAPVRVELEEPAVVPAGPAATPPGAEAARRRPKPPRPPGVDLEPGQLICDQCRTPNRPDARFCRRCGTSLLNADVVRRPPWWRRLVPRRRTFAAGERKQRRRGDGRRATVGAVRSTTSRLLRALALVTLAAAVVGVAVGWRSGVGDRARDAISSVRIALFPRYEPAIPTAMRATSHVRGHTARGAFDKNRRTFWAEGAPGDGANQKLIVRFGREVDLGRVGVTLGDQRAPQHFTDRPVPHTLRFRLFDRHGRRATSTVVVLAQKPDFQRFKLEGDNVTRAVVTIMSSYHAQKANHSAAIAEVEFFEKR